MLDFNKRKRILKKLSDTAEMNVLLLIPCLIAAGLVKLFYHIACNIDIALSDKNGNFLGIKHQRNEKKATRRQDDIVYIKRGFVQRTVSLVLSFAFVMMLVPTAFPVVDIFAGSTLWSPTGTTNSVFVILDDDPNIVRDVAIPFDTFTAPEILSVSADGFRSCEIKWDLNKYKGVDGLPYVFFPDKLSSGADGVLDSIEVCAFVTKDGKTTFQTGLELEDIGSSIDLSNSNGFNNVSDTIKVINLDPDASYDFVLNAKQRWAGYNVQNAFVEYKELDANGVVLSDTITKTTESYSASYSYYDANGNLVTDDIVDISAGRDRYLPGTYKSGAYSPVERKKIRGSNVKPMYIPHYSTANVPEAHLDARRLADVKTTANYVDGDNNKKEVKIGYSGSIPSEAKGLLVFRGIDKGTSTSYSCIAAVPINDVQGSLVYTDTKIEMTTAYRYYVVPATWYSSEISHIMDYLTSGNEDYFFTGNIPGKDDVSFNNTAAIYTDTATPKGFTLTQDGTNFNLSWNKVTGATGYILSRKVGDGDWTVIANIDDPDTVTYTDKNIAYDVEYSYSIVAVNSNNNDNESAAALIEKKKLAIEELSAPYYVSAVAGDDYAEVTWYCDDEKADGFDIQYVMTSELKNIPASALAQMRLAHSDIPSDDSDALTFIKANYAKEYNDLLSSLYDTAFETNGSVISKSREDVLVSGTNKFGYTVRNLVSGESYSFRVRSYILTPSPDDENVQLKKPASEFVPKSGGYAVLISTDFDAPMDLKAVSADGNITVTWRAVDTATGYEIEVARYDGNGNKIHTYIDDVTDTKYELKDLRAGDIYVFRVRATKRISGQTELKKTAYTGYYAVMVGNPIIKVTDLKAVLDENGDKVNVTWTAATGEFTGYYLYITCDGSTITKDITTNSYTHTDIKYGKSYSYYVRPYRSVVLSDGTVQYFEGDKSNVESVTIGGTVGFPTDLTATPGEGQITLDWADVTGATGYIVYASCDGKTETFNVSKSEFVHTGLTPGKTYSYYVVAYKTINGSPVYSVSSPTVSATVGGTVAAPVDFAVTTNETTAIISWKAVENADGYTVFGKSDSGKTLEIDVSGSPYTHTGLTEGDSWSYYVKAYKLSNNNKIYSNATTTITVKIGASYPPPNDLVATPGNRAIALSWTTGQDVDGYIVYVYDENTGDFQPLSIVSNGSYQHTGLKNGKKYTYMVAAYKFVNGVRVIGDYSLAVSAIPTSGDAADVDYTISIKGTAPYGISHSTLISAAANHEAFDEPVDAYFSVNDESTRAVKEVLRNYANGLKSFIVYPFDISLYLENTLIETEPNDGFNITFTVPVPDVMQDYRDYITVIHLKDDGTEVIEDTVSDNIFVQSTDLEVLPSAIVDVGGVWCIQFTTSSCSPFAFVVYKDNLDDIGSGSSASGMGGFSGSFNTGVLLMTSLPDILPVEKKTKFVERLKKRYRIKK